MLWKMDLLPQPWRFETVTRSPLNLFDRKVMLCVWWNFEGVIHWEFVPNGRAVDADLYSQKLERVREILRRTYPALVNRNRVLLQQDNARSHTARTTMIKIQEFGGIELLPQPAYSPWSCAFRLPSASILCPFIAWKKFKTLNLWKWVSPNSSHQKPETGVVAA